jgi:hypothetical protein
VVQFEDAILSEQAEPRAHGIAEGNETGAKVARSPGLWVPLTCLFTHS